VSAGEPRQGVAPIAAGDTPGSPEDALVPPAVARIMTGAPMPSGADRVIPVEMSTASGPDRGTVVFQAEAALGDHIRRRGEVLRIGDTLLPAGSLLTPGALSLLATHG